MSTDLLNSTPIIADRSAIPHLPVGHHWVADGGLCDGEGDRVVSTWRCSACGATAMPCRRSASAVLGQHPATWIAVTNPLDTRDLYHYSASTSGWTRKTFRARHHTPAEACLAADEIAPYLTFLDAGLPGSEALEAAQLLVCSDTSH